MYRYPFALFLSAYSIVAHAQVEKAATLQVMKIKGGSLFQKNISFGVFQTQKFRRSIGSYFTNRAIIPANLLKVEGVPLYHKEKRRSKDVFHFHLSQQNGEQTYVEVLAAMLQNETFHLFGRQDSSFFGTANTDVLLGTIQLGTDSATWWQIAASNLNGSKNGPQKGMITQGDKTITFERTTVLLREYGDNNSTDTLFNGLHMAYRFAYNGETIAAVSFKENERLCWMKNGLTPPVQTAVASTIAVLRLRKNIYH